jgi:hypothetical protein
MQLQGHNRSIMRWRKLRLSRPYVSPIGVGRRRDVERQKRYAAEFGRARPKGFRSIRAHDLKHKYGHRLRAAGVTFEDRKLLLGLKSDRVTTHYSAPGGRFVD